MSSMHKTIHSKLILTALVALFVVLQPALPVQAENSATQKTSAQYMNNMTWELFVKGCVAQSSDLGSWADKQVHLVKSTKETGELAGIWKTLGYPVAHRVKNLWGIVNKPVWMYEHENHGCTVTSYASIDPAQLEKYFTSMAESQTAQDIEVKMQKKTDPQSGKFVILMAFNPNIKSQKAYFMARNLGDGDTKTKTILYYVRSADNLNIN